MNQLSKYLLVFVTLLTLTGMASAQDTSFEYNPDGNTLSTPDGGISLTAVDTQGITVNGNNYIELQSAGSPPEGSYIQSGTVGVEDASIIETNLITDDSVQLQIQYYDGSNNFVGQTVNYKYTSNGTKTENLNPPSQAESLDFTYYKSSDSGSQVDGISGVTLYRTTGVNDAGTYADFLPSSQEINIEVESQGYDGVNNWTSMDFTVTNTDEGVDVIDNETIDVESQSNGAIGIFHSGTLNFTESDRDFGSGQYSVTLDGVTDQEGNYNPVGEEVDSFEIGLDQAPNYQGSIQLDGTSQGSAELYNFPSVDLRWLSSQVQDDSGRIVFDITGNDTSYTPETTVKIVNEETGETLLNDTISVDNRQLFGDVEFLTTINLTQNLDSAELSNGDYTIEFVDITGVNENGKEVTWEFTGPQSEISRQVVDTQITSVSSTEVAEGEVDVTFNSEYDIDSVGYDVNPIGSGNFQTGVANLTQTGGSPDGMNSYEFTVEPNQAKVGEFEVYLLDPIKDGEIVGGFNSVRLDGTFGDNTNLDLNRPTNITTTIENGSIVVGFDAGYSADQFVESNFDLNTGSDQGTLTITEKQSVSGDADRYEITINPEFTGQYDFLGWSDVVYNVNGTEQTIEISEVVDENGDLSDGGSSVPEEYIDTYLVGQEVAGQLSVSGEVYQDYNYENADVSYVHATSVVLDVDDAGNEIVQQGEWTDIGTVSGDTEANRTVSYSETFSQSFDESGEYAYGLVVVKSENEANPEGTDGNFSGSFDWQGYEHTQVLSSTEPFFVASASEPQSPIASLTGFLDSILGGIVETIAGVFDDGDLALPQLENPPQVSS